MDAAATFDNPLLLKPTEFLGMEKGLLLGKEATSSDLLLGVPVEHCINYKTLLNDTAFLEMLGDARSQLFSLPCLMAVFLLLRRNSSKLYQTWTSSLPTDYNLPFSWSTEEINTLPISLRTEALRLQRLCSDSYDEVQKFLPSQISFEDFRWAFSSVHSRCVKWPETVVDGFLNVSGDKDYALVPFADFFNHSCNVLVRTEINDLHLNFFVHSGSFRKGEQAFINYGLHSNSYFLLQYGFVPSENNAYDFIGFSLDQFLHISQYEDADRLPLEDLFKKHAISFEELYLYSNGVTETVVKMVYIVITEEEHWPKILENISYIESLSDDYHSSATGLFRITCDFVRNEVENDKIRLSLARDIRDVFRDNLQKFLDGWCSILDNAKQYFTDKSLHTFIR